MSEEDKRLLWIAYRRHLEHLRIELERQGVPIWEVARHFPPFPEELRGLTCGAHARQSGQPCKRTDLYSSGRCRYHVGLSTGPKTEAGRQQCRENGKRDGRQPRTEPHESQ